MPLRSTAAPSCRRCHDFVCETAGDSSHPDRRVLLGAGVGVGRAVIAVPENGQQADGSILVPEASHPYMAGMDVIRPA